MSGIGTRDELSATQVLGAVHAHQARGVEPTTENLASWLGIRPGSAERDRLNDLLWHLHRARKVRYEREQASDPFRWRVAGSGR